MAGSPSALARYKLRLRRKRLLWRALRKRREISAVVRRTRLIQPDDILLFATLRNEALRLPHFLQHYRTLGVDHFLIVDNGSDDGTAALLAEQPDVSLWSTQSSYKASRFGMDWLTGLQWWYGHGHWVLTVDADELLIYPDWERRSLPALVSWMEARGHFALGTLMLDLYPKGPVAEQSYRAGQDPTDVLNWFDAYGYWVQRQPKLDNLWLQGGPRARLFFEDQPQLAPTLNKIPLVRWHRHYVYVNATHNALPARLNRAFDGDRPAPPTGVLLHTKLLPDAAERARVEKQRAEHFAQPDTYGAYYDHLGRGPDFWHADAHAYEDWQQLLRLRLMFGGDWHPN